jgi:hypothetical protein
MGQALNVLCTASWWQATVLTLMHSSDLIVVDISSVKAGTGWEIRQLKKRGLLSRTVFIIGEEYAEGMDACLGEYFSPEERPVVVCYDFRGRLNDAPGFLSRLIQLSGPHGPAVSHASAAVEHQAERMREEEAPSRVGSELGRVQISEWRAGATREMQTILVIVAGIAVSAYGVCQDVEWIFTYYRPILTILAGGGLVMLGMRMRGWRWSDGYRAGFLVVALALGATYLVSFAAVFWQINAKQAVISEAIRQMSATHFSLARDQRDRECEPIAGLHLSLSSGGLLLAVIYPRELVYGADFIQWDEAQELSTAAAVALKADNGKLRVVACFNSVGFCRVVGGISGSVITAPDPRRLHKLCEKGHLAADSSVPIAP